MVYESSTRRIYSSSPRPVISTSYSYSPVSPVDDEEMYGNANYYVQLPIFPAPAPPVGPIPIVTKLQRQPHLVLAYTPGGSKGHIINPLAIPRIAHKRLVAVSPPPHRGHNGQNYYDMLESGITGNYGGNRIILVRYRPTPPPVPRSKVVYIEDVTDPYGSRVLRRELSPSPSMIYGSPWEITTPSAMVPISRPMFSLHNIPLRDTSQAQLLIPSVGYRNIRWSASEVKEVADLRRLYVRDRNPDVGYSPLNKALLYRMPSPCYVDPSIPQNYYIGRGNLACLSFAGGRPISKRRRFYPDYEDKIRDEVIFRSFYTKLRDAASVGRNAGKRPIYQPIYYSRKTILGEANVPKREPKESKWVERALANEKPPKPRAAKPSSVKQPAAPVATETVIASPRKESLKLEASPRTPPAVQPVSVTLPGPRKSITEIIKDDLPKVENLPEESVTVKMPRKQPTPPPREPTPPPPKEPTPTPPKEATPPPPPKEPTPPPPKEPTPPPPKEATPPPPKEPTPPPREPTPPPPKEPTPPPPKEPTPPPPKEPTPPPPEKQPEEVPAAGEEQAKEPAADEPAPSSEPASEEVPAPSEPTGEADDASNKGEVEDIQLDEEITLDEVCDVEENDLEIESDDPETSQSAATADQMPQVESPQETEGSAANASEEPAATETAAPTEDTVKAPKNDQDAVSPTPVSIVVADIDGPIPPPDEEAPAVQEDPLTVEQIQLEAEKRRSDFAQLLDDLHEVVTTVTKLERVATIVSKSCELAQEEHKEQEPPTDSQKRT